MRIGFTGAGGTGKTTLAKLIAERTGLPFIPSVARDVFIAWGWTEERQRIATPEDKWRLQKAILDKKIESDLANPHGVFDRTLLDHLMYVSYRCNDYIDKSVHRSLEELTIENLRKYDLVVHVEQFDWDPPSDGLREDSYPYRWMQDQMIRGFIVKHQITAAKVLDADAETRAKQLVGLIDLCRLHNR